LSAKKSLHLLTAQCQSVICKSLWPFLASTVLTESLIGSIQLQCSRLQGTCCLRPLWLLSLTPSSTRKMKSVRKFFFMSCTTVTSFFLLHTMSSLRLLPWLAFGCRLNASWRVFKHFWDEGSPHCLIEEKKQHQHIPAARMQKVVDTDSMHHDHRCFCCPCEWDRHAISTAFEGRCKPKTKKTLSFSISHVSKDQRRKTNVD